MLEKETLNLKEITAVLGERPFGMPESVQEVLKATEEREIKGDSVRED